jgi:DNA helicase-2/ATP-dependent DNA helicase PcrA
MSKREKENLLSTTLCLVDDAHTCTISKDSKCNKYGKCRICEKTEEQVDYILSPASKCTYLSACAGSGKTEVLGMKTAYEICSWDQKSSGIAVLTFTNEAANTIKERVRLFYPHNVPTVHYVGTFASFVHGYIAQKFGYAFFQRDSEILDKSFSVIDKNTKIYDNTWLNNYKLNFPIPPRMSPIYANQISFQFGDNKWYIYFGEGNSIDISEYYEQSAIQENIKKIRKQNKKDYLFKYDFFKDKILECKKKFWNDGFANFDDMNLIAKRCLKDDGIVKLLAKKFPLIMVDECQDLSFVELEILGLLSNAGSSIHYIGDLNQAIYSFKDAQPQYFIKQISEKGFKTMHLKDNFRSCQKIVNVACALQSINQGIVGHAQDLCCGNAAGYYEYENEEAAVECFIELLRRYNIAPHNAIVLTRNSSLKDKLNTGTTLNYEQHAIINAVQLWKINTQESKKKALLLLGWQIQKWLKSRGRKDNYFCPDTFDDVFKWRLMLRDVLNNFAASDIVNAFNDKTYANWYHSAKDDVIRIVDLYIQKVLGPDKSIFSSAVLRTPSGTSSVPIQVILDDESAKLRIDTIHSVKGCSYDAVLLVSASDGRGKTGYWENWIDDKDETTRFGYVASTRPKYLLVWAVPKLTDEQRIKIETIGLQNISI